MSTQNKRPEARVKAKEPQRTLEEIGAISDDDLRNLTEEFRSRSREAEGICSAYSQFRITEAHYGITCIQELLKTAVHGVRTDGFYYHGDQKIVLHEKEFIKQAHEAMLGQHDIDLDTLIYATLGDKTTAEVAIKAFENEHPEYTGLLSIPKEREQRFARLCSQSPKPRGTVLEEVTDTLHIIGRDHFNLPEEIIKQVIGAYALNGQKVSESNPHYKTHLVEAEQRVSRIVKQAYESGNRIHDEELTALTLWAEQEYNAEITDPKEYFDHIFTREVYRDAVVQTLFDKYEVEAVSPTIRERINANKEEFMQSVHVRFNNALMHSKTEGVDETLARHIKYAEAELVEEVIAGAERVSAVYQLTKDLYEILPDREYHADIEPLFIRYCEMNGISAEHIIKDGFKRTYEHTQA